MKPTIEKLQWPPPPARVQLGEGEVHVWSAPLDVTASTLAQGAATLSPAEKERAAKFRFERHRHRFTAGRAALREVLGRYLQIKPARLDFAYSTRGKPELSAVYAGAGLDFNLGHSEDLALIAVTRGGPVGVDVEHVRAIREMDELVARFFSARESRLFAKLPPRDRPRAFFNLWTRKEALLKATGEGIGGGLNRVEVTFLPGEPARFLALPGLADEITRWSLHDLQPAAGFVGALATPVAVTKVCTWSAGGR